MMDGNQWKNQRLNVQDLLRRDLNVGADVREHQINKLSMAIKQYLELE